jgi:hypothetical protein
MRSLWTAHIAGYGRGGEWRKYPSATHLGFVHGAPASTYVEVRRPAVDHGSYSAETIGNTVDIGILGAFVRVIAAQSRCHLGEPPPSAVSLRNGARLRRFRPSLYVLIGWGAINFPGTPNHLLAQKRLVVVTSDRNLRIKLTRESRTACLLLQSSKPGLPVHDGTHRRPYCRLWAAVTEGRRLYSSQSAALPGRW